MKQKSGTWRHAKRKSIPDGNGSGALGITYNLEGKLLIFSGGESEFDPASRQHNRLTLWSFESGEVKTLFETKPRTARSFSGSAAFSHDGKMLAWGGKEYTITLRYLATGTERVFWSAAPTIMPPYPGLHGPADLIYSVAFSPDDALLASASYDCAVKVWNLKTGKKHATLVGHKDVVCSVAFSPDGKLLASGASDDTVKIWKIGAGK